MPWTKDDVDRHKKGLSDAEKERWVAIANKALKSCLADGGGQSECEGRAIRIANAKCRTNAVMVFAQNLTGEVRTETLGGIQYLVAPVVSIVEGVLNGELLLAEEFGRYPGAWDGRPVVLGHPCDGDGLPISANDPQTLERCMVGTVYNTTSNGKLQHEMWIEVRRAERTADGKELLRRLRGNNPVEVSTAYFRDVDEESGEHAGVPYVGVARNIRPDHLAALLHEEGACSWRDGCGAPRANEQSKDDEIREIRESWYDLMSPSKAITESWIFEVYDDYVVVEHSGGYWQVPYSVEDGNVVFAQRDQWQRVEQKKEWIAVQANVRSSARTPTYSGTSSGSWNKPGLEDYVKAYGKDPGGTDVGDMSSAFKSWVAAHTLLGDAGADNYRDLSLFAVVGADGKLYENALRSVLGGRGAQAQIPAAARESARNRARSLLEKEFDADFSENGILAAIKGLAAEVSEFFTHQRRNRMDEKMQRILDADRGFTQEGLEGMPECALDAILGLLPAETETELETHQEEEPKAPDVAEVVKSVLEELGVTKAITELRAGEDKERADLIGSLAKQVRLNQTQLEALDTESLRALSLTFRPANFGGQGGEPVVNDDEWEPYPIPAVFEKEVNSG